MESFYFKFLKVFSSKISLLLFVGLLTSNNVFAQIIPTLGELECFVAGTGGVFLDNGGTEANPVNEELGNEGDYFNCGCETVTTLCSPDGSAITIDFTAFDVFASFDFIQIFDGDNAITGTLLYNNGAGGINAGDGTLDELIASNGGSSLTGTTGCLTVLFFSTNVVSDFGWEANITVASGATHPGDNLPCGTNLNCLAPPNISVELDSDTTAIVSWMPVDSADSYNIEYGLAGFTLGTGTMGNTTNTSFTLTGLTPITDYQYYVQSDCGDGEFSNNAGPFSFTTPILNDVGIIAINSPNSGCGLSSSETISVTMQNFGAAPQALIPFYYSINGAPASIMIPLDGYFTNVIGMDSLVTLEFETTANLSLPGTYEIAAWTELETDLNFANDTTFFTITNIPLVNSFPFAQDFENDNGGWTVTDDSQNPTWDFGQPVGTVISNAASGVNAWVTNLSGDYLNNELSFVLSNCFDFSNLSVDPDLSFSLNHETETNWDGGWLEISFDGGTAWEKVGAMGSGFNWYNNNIGVGDVWSGDSGGWIFAKHSLIGAAGESDVRLRFVFDSDGSVSTFDGIGFDNIWITTPEANDLGTQSVVNSNTALECGSPNDQVTITFVNNGTTAQTGFNVAYQVNNNLPVIENVGSLSLAPNESSTYTFLTSFNSTGTGVFNISAWTELTGEANLTNDTASISFATFQVLPFREDFEGTVLPNGWSSDELAPVSNAHNNNSFVAFDNLSSGDTNFELVTPPIGPIGVGDSLSFDYRYVNAVTGGVAPEVLNAGDSLIVQISTDCGISYNNIFTITESNHVTSNELATVRIDLASFVGLGAKFRFLATWGSGDYFIDLDNINVFQCVPLNLAIETNQESLANIGDGTAIVTGNNDRGPYSYEWDFGATTSEVTDLTGGTYFVTVTDAFGCFEVAEVTVDIGVNTKDLSDLYEINLFPNPTIDVATLDMIFSKSVDVHVHVINTIGQVVYETSVLKTTQEQLTLDLQNFPNGMYFVRIKVEDQTLVKKLMKGQP